MAEMTFRQMEFFGGAMTAEIPEGFGDVSLLRPVPSHQEIYLSATGFTSLILEINERVEDLSSDEEALRYHFDDVVTPGDISHVWETSNVMQLPNFPSPTPTLCLLATASPPPAPPSSSQQEPGIATTTSPQPDPVGPPRTSTAILLTLIRLRPQSTDLLLTINVPFRHPLQVPSGDPSSSSTLYSSNQTNGDHLPRPPPDEGINFQTFNYVPLVEEGLVIRDRLLQSLVVRDWSLFESDDA
ncbi:multicopy suppressor of ts gsp1, partial [Sticta canariensis]|nr:multicopy suppressor of ts gsp1 [Sticta canariensis]